MGDDGSANQPKVAIEGLGHSYGSTAVLDGIDVEIADSESLALLGPSGCGKTTLLRLIAGLERPDRGTISLGSRQVTGPHTFITPERRNVGMVFQEWALFPHLTVAGNVGYGLARGERKDGRVEQALGLVGLRGLADRLPGTLSGGQQQRVALARALAPKPSVLLLDEPFSNLDSALRVELRTDVHRILKRLQITSIFVTHDQEEAFVLGDRIAVMRHGRLVQVDCAHALYTKPVDREVAEFVGSGAVLRASAHSGIAESAFGPLPVSIDEGTIDVLVRPEQLRIVSGDDGEVDLVEYYGHDAMVFVRVGGSLVRVRTAPSVQVRRGDKVSLRFQGEIAHAFAVDPDAPLSRR